MVLKSFYKGEKRKVLLGNQTPPPHCTAHPRVSPGHRPPGHPPCGGVRNPVPKRPGSVPGLVQTPVYLCQAAVAPVKQRRRSPRWSVPRPGAGATYLCTSPGHPRRPGGTPAVRIAQQELDKYLRLEGRFLRLEELHFQWGLGESVMVLSHQDTEQNQGSQDGSRWPCL